MTDNHASCAKNRTDIAFAACQGINYLVIIVVTLHLLNKYFVRMIDICFRVGDSHPIFLSYPLPDASNFSPSSRISSS
jgi:hypothetical protein